MSRLRRAQTLLVFWQGSRLCFYNFATRVTVCSDLVCCDLLNFFSRWRLREQAVAHFAQYTPRTVRSTVAQLLRHGLLVSEGSQAAVRDSWIANEWSSWLPEAGFHFATKDAPYLDRSKWSIARRKRLLPNTPQPTKLRTLNGADRISLLPRCSLDSEFVRVLQARKTHRRFSNRGLGFEQVSELLRLVWGVTGYIDSPIYGKLFHKTSPSAGARHPGEVYLMALRVKGLKRGLYHYDPLHHRLEAIRTGLSRKDASRYCAGQHFIRKAAALFIMTAVFPRTMWKYPHPRAYRVVLLDAGHLCQTFCLVATWLGLAPFCTAALKDTLIERDLGIDGIRESVLYVAGVGVLMVKP